MFKIESDGTVCIKKTRKLTPKQLAILKCLDEGQDQENYLQSILGLRKRAIELDRLKRRNGFSSQGIDRLAGKERNSVLDRLHELCNPSNDFRPNDSEYGQWVGIEIECLFKIHCDNCDDDSRNEDGDECEHDDAKGSLKSEFRDLIREHKITRCSLHEDGSVHDEDKKTAGLEFTILINTKFGYDKLEKLLNLIKRHKGYVNKTCGLHVHLDSRHLNKSDAKKHGRYLGHALPVLYHMVPESRRDNYYCKPGVSRIDGNRECRYRAVNMTAYKKYKTIEVRLHSGTLEFNKIINWIEILKAVIASKPIRAMKTFQDFLDVVNIPDRLVEYMERRMQEFSPGFLNVIPMPQPVEYQLVAVTTPSRSMVTFNIEDTDSINSLFDTEVA